MAGLTVLVTRPEREAACTGRQLAALGHTSLLAPVLVVQATGAALPWNGCDALVAASPRAFDAVSTVPRAGLTRPVYAVGRRTAEAARARGFEDVRVGAGEGSSLATLVAMTLPRPAQLLCLFGADRKAALEGALRAAGYAVTVVVVYEARRAAPWSASVAAQIASGTVAAALHYSRRSAALALDAAAEARVGALFVALRHYCLSDDCAAPLAAAGAPRLAVATRPDEASLLALLPPGVGAGGATGAR